MDVICRQIIAITAKMAKDAERRQKALSIETVFMLHVENKS